MSPVEPKPPSSPASKGWYDTLVSGVGTLDALPTGFDLGPINARRWTGWRLRALFIAAALCVLGIVLLARTVAVSPWVDAKWTLNERDELVLTATASPALKPLLGQVLWGLERADGQQRPLHPAALHARGPRWTPEATSRDALTAFHLALAGEAGPWRLVFAGGQRVEVPLSPRGVMGTGWAFWPLTLVAASLMLVGAVVWLARPEPRNAFYLVIALCQGLNLAVTAVHSVPGLPLPGWSVRHDLGLRFGLDLVSAAALVHVFAMHPVRVNYGALVAAAGWLTALVGIGLLATDLLPQTWWAAQGVVLGLAVLALWVLHRSHALAGSPFTALMRQLGAGTLLVLLLVLAIVAAADLAGTVSARVADIATAAWSLLFVGLLLLVPMLTRSQTLVREFALLAGISAAATGLDLLFVSWFSWGPFASVAVAVFISLGVYAVVRDRLVNRLTGSQALTLDRIFEQLYRAGRAIEQEPERRQVIMEAFLRELFDPLELELVPRALARSRAVGDGAALLVPAPRDGYTDFDASQSMLAHAWVLKHAHRGKRLFTAEDARLADRVLQHLRRAVVYDRAVERGRSEERRRIAQDLHDDIGARLLTLMYKAQTPELEDYLRHTLQDLKTLTRGLAASEHPLSHAVAEWKADIGQRLGAAQMGLHWSFTYDRDLALTVTQWSGLTRILRELVSNAIYHAKATRLHVDGSLHDGRLLLWIADDGQGRDPTKWSHGLGLGGVRKRVRALGGAVRWRENSPRGIICEVQIHHLDQPPVPAVPPRPGERDTRL
jgi:signal transduction histidine kinase